MNEQTAVPISEAGPLLPQRNESDPAPEPYTAAWVHELVSYHRPSEAGVEQIANIRSAAEHFINVLIANCPASGDLEMAIRLARLSMMQANGSIVLGGMM